MNKSTPALVATSGLLLAVVTVYDASSIAAMLGWPLRHGEGIVALAGLMISGALVSMGTIGLLGGWERRRSSRIA